jgi:hypothetical protein
VTERTGFGNLGALGYGLRIAKPGSSWNTSNKSDLYFSTEWTHTTLIHATGQLVKGNIAYYAELPFIPVVEWAIIDTGLSRLTGVYQSGWLSGSPSGRNRTAIEPYLKIYTDRLDFGSFPITTPNAGTFTIRYIVYNIPGGA